MFQSHGFLVDLKPSRMMFSALVLSCVFQIIAHSNGLECGVAYNVDSRIVGGYDSGKLMYPWFANLRRNVPDKPPGCGGALITSRHVLTAAHCFPKGQSGEDVFDVALNTYDHCNDTEPREVHKVSKVVVHENFTSVGDFYDIALVTLEDTTNIPPACMPPKSTQNMSLPGLIMGFGYTEEGGEEPCHLMQADVTKYSPEQCEDTYLPERDKNQPLTFCGGADGIDSCQGDSGGPFMTQGTDGRYALSGIISYGYGCAREGYPGLYTNVAAYLDWINDKLDGEQTETASFAEASAMENRGYEYREPQSAEGTQQITPREESRIWFAGDRSNTGSSNREKLVYGQPPNSGKSFDPYSNAGSRVTFPENQLLGSLASVRRQDYDENEPNSDLQGQTDSKNNGAASSRGVFFSDSLPLGRKLDYSLENPNSALQNQTNSNKDTVFRPSLYS